MLKHKLVTWSMYVFFGLITSLMIGGMIAVTYAIFGDRTQVYGLPFIGAGMIISSIILMLPVGITWLVSYFYYEKVKHATPKMD